MQITPEDQAKVAAAIKAAEARTDGEIAAIVSPASDDYADAVLHWALVVALFPLAVSAAFPSLLLWGVALIDGGWEEPSLRFLLTLLTIKCALLFLVARWIFGRPAIRMALVPAATKARRVRRRALMLFRAGTEQRTLSKTGVLLYLSLAERRAEIVADAAIHARVSPDRWGEAMAAMLDEVRGGRPGAGMVAAVERIGAIVAEHFPKTPGDANELPDRLIEL